MRAAPFLVRLVLLSEDEEDAYLDEGMQAEENVFSVDYDVWIDEGNYPLKSDILFIHGQRGWRWARSSASHSTGGCAA